MKHPFLKQLALLTGIVALAAGLAWAVVTPLTPIVPVGPVVVGQPAANSLNFTFTACDASNGNSFPLTGRDILLIENTDMGASHTVTITSVADQLGRTQDVTAYSLAAGPTYAAYSFRGASQGWKQTDGTVHLTCSASTVSFAVISPTS